MAASLRRGRLWLLAALIAALGSLALLAPAAQADPLPSCANHTWRGNSGYISVQTSPNGYIPWGIYMYEAWRNAGPWTVDVFVNDRRVDHKFQLYAPHGSVNPVDAPHGGVLRFEAHHVDPSGTEHDSVPNGCVIP